MIKKSDTSEMWIAPRPIVKSTDVDPAWDSVTDNQPHSTRLLEYADIALGVKKIEPWKRRMPMLSTHETSRIDPYSQ
jgi:hypothetical protein